MSPEIDIAIEAAAWDEEPEAEAAARRAIEAVLAESGAADAEVSVALTDNVRIRELNWQWRGQDKATNVLSFPAPEAPRGQPHFLGDVVIAFETVRDEARQEDKPFLHHLSHLAVHGTLHLLGHDHENDDDAERMEAREREILARLGIPDPYRDAAAKRTEPA